MEDFAREVGPTLWLKFTSYIGDALRLIVYFEMEAYFNWPWSPLTPFPLENEVAGNQIIFSIQACWEHSFLV